MGVLNPAQVNNLIVSKILRGLDLEKASATTLTIYAGSTAGTDDGATVMVVASDLVLDTATVGKNGLDAGTLAINTWYHVWMIWNRDTEEVASRLCLSRTAPTLPASFEYKRRVGAIRTDGSANIMNFRQYQKRVFFETLTVSGSGAVDISSIVPEGARSILLSGAGSSSNNSAAGVTVNGVIIAWQRPNWVSTTTLNPHQWGNSAWVDVALDRIINISRSGSTTLTCFGYQYEYIG